ncbi:MAG TPA: AAA family ATPase [Kofleriaceae bacterium]|nr:AAA family ATPase [Kofleriaceae bacterium]
MLRRLRVKNFKLLRDVDVELERAQPTVFIGTNASGKSTIIEVLDFLRRCADDDLEAAVIAHGGFSAMRTIGRNTPIEITTSWDLTPMDDRAATLTWHLAFEATPHGLVTIRAETLHVGDKAFVETADDGRRLVIDDTRQDAPAQAVSDPRRLAFHAFASPGGYHWLGLLEGFCGGLHAFGTLSAGPAWARFAAEAPSARDTVVISTSDRVAREGIGLGNALYNLQVHHQEAWLHLERAFRAEFPFVKRLVFPPDPGGSRISFAIDDQRFPGRLVYASEMSDGMITLLTLLTLIAHTWEVSALALDEPDAHLHPSAVRRLLAFAASRPEQRRLIIVTHSSSLLDELAEPAASIRIVESTSSGASISRLDTDALLAWRRDYSLSDLRRKGHLDQANSDYEPNP